MNQMQKAVANLEFAILHKIPDYTSGTKKSSKRKIKEAMYKCEYDTDFIEEVNDDFCKGFYIAKEMIINLFKAERKRLGMIQENLALGDKIRSMSNEQIAYFLTGCSDGCAYMKKLEELNMKV